MLHLFYIITTFEKLLLILVFLYQKNVLQSNPGWGFDKKCQFMDKLVWEVSQQYKWSSWINRMKCAHNFIRVHE